MTVPPSTAGSEEASPSSSPDRTRATLRTGSLALAIAIGVMLAATLSVRPLAPALRFGVVVVLFIGYLASTLLGALATGAVAAQALRLPARARRTVLATLGAGVALALGFPGLAVVWLGEASSVYWYLVYLLFAPSAAVVAGQVSVFGLAQGARAGPPTAVPALVPLLVAPGFPLLAGAIFYGRLEPFGTVAAVLAGVAMASDLAVYAAARGGGPGGAPASPA